MNSCREPPSKQLLPVLPQKDCLSSVKLNSLQASEETTSSLTVKPSEPQASCCFCYKPPERLAWAGTGLEPEESRFPHCLHYLPRVQEQVWAWGHCRVRNAPEIFFLKKRGGNNSLLVLSPVQSGSFSSLTLSLCIPKMGAVVSEKPVRADLFSFSAYS